MGWFEGQAKHDADEKNMSSETETELILQELPVKKKDWYIAALKEMNV